MTDHADIVRERVSHIARGCRAGTSHNPAVYENDIDAALDALEAEIARLTEGVSVQAEEAREQRERAEAAEEERDALAVSISFWEARVTELEREKDEHRTYASRWYHNARAAEADLAECERAMETAVSAAAEAQVAQLHAAVLAALTAPTKGGHR